jgi:hypothetical protein
MTATGDEILLEGGGRTRVHRRGGTVVRDAGPWTPAAIVDAYGLSARQRAGFFDRIVEFAVCDTAAEADSAAVTPELTAHPAALWAMAWRARSAAWMLRHRGPLEAALAAGMA